MLRKLVILFVVLLVLAIAGAGAGLYGFWYFGRGLPDYRQLADYEPPVMTRVHAGDGRLLAEYAIEKRVFVPLDAIPRRVRQAFLSAEDKAFYEHPGVNIMSILRAAVTNLKQVGTGRRPVGASTITQQVAKNFLLTNEVSITRKAKEAILALRIEQAFSKERILELYLNEIYLGQGSYGVAAAALNYFNKSLDELTTAEAAYLAALPKAPNNYHPTRKHEAAVERRNWVVGRLLEDGVITADEAARARAEPLVTATRAPTEYVSAPSFAEEVRRELADRYGEDNLYKGGLSVRTTLDPRLQEIADRVLRQGLRAYDRRHGWRGPLASLAAEGAPVPEDWARRMAERPREPGQGDWIQAVVLGLDKGGADIGLKGGGTGRLPLAELTWARRQISKNQTRGPGVKAPSDVLALGDVVLVEPVTERDRGQGKEPEKYPEGTYGLRQIPEIDGGLVALDPHTGRVLALSGGYAPERSEFNRATQAMRQPGSAFKPFIYLAALDKGFTPSTLILDAPFVIDQGPGLPKWKPGNYTKKFYGPSTMRLGIEKSRNLMTVRLAQTIGMDTVADYARRFGITDNLPEQLSMALGAGETTLLDLTTAYAMLVNGGRKIEPSLIDRIQDRDGKTVFRHDHRTCADCQAPFWMEQAVPRLPDNRPRLTDPASAYQVVSMLEGVVERGTGRRIRAVGKPLAGKTGTSNDSQDTWFVGFSPDLALGVYAGFDTPRTLGRREQGASVAAPVFRDFMAEALEGRPAIPFRIPPDIRLVRVDAATGMLARPGDKNVILEAFRPGSEPKGGEAVLEGDSDEAVTVPTAGTGGLY
ncbi:MAG: penicillin-binding protein 1A [Rhodobacterales bacterium]|nr:penicillin-binding protein 1A [Rhodobacterales bacterium]